MKNLILILFVILVSACSSSAKKSTEKLYYRFPEANSFAVDKGMLIKRPTAMGIIGNRPMVVQDTNGALKQMHHNFWLDSPKVLLHNYLLKTFSNSPKETDLILNSQILKLEKKQNTALLEIKFTAANLQGKPVFNKIYSLETSLTSNNIPLFAKSIGKMLEQIVSQLTQDLQ